LLDPRNVVDNLERKEGEIGNEGTTRILNKPGRHSTYYRVAISVQDPTMSNISQASDYLTILVTQSLGYLVFHMRAWQRRMRALKGTSERQGPDKSTLLVSGYGMVAFHCGCTTLNRISIC
jgi:hypothetical protein